MNNGHFTLDDESLLFSGNSNIRLATNIATHLNRTLGNMTVGKFSDEETNVEIHEHVRGHDIFIIQSISQPANDRLMELLIIADAFNRAAARSITAVIPYFGYARQDRRPDFCRTPISSKLVADLIQTSGVDQVVTIDLHSGQQQGFFGIPVVELSAKNVIDQHITSHLLTNGHDPVVVSPDIGGIARARQIAKQLGTEIAFIDKRRQKANTSEVMNIIGNVKNKDCIIIDDIIDTAGTLCHAAEALKVTGEAKTVNAYATHGVFSGTALTKINQSALDKVVVTDTIEQNQLPPNITVVSIAETIAETLHRIRYKYSVTSMYNNTRGDDQ